MSLVELMIAMLLGLALMLAVTQSFLSQRQTFALTEASSEVQESGRLALQLLTRSVRNADYWGCLGSADAVHSILNNASDGASPFRFRQGVSVVQSEGVRAGRQAGSAVLTLSGLDTSRSAGLSRNGESSQSELFAAQGVDLADLFQGGSEDDRSGEVLAVSNCERAEIFKAGVITGNRIRIEPASSAIPGNARGNLINSGRDYRGGRITPVTGKRYFIRQQADGRSALMYQTLNTTGGSGDYHNANELVAGIERMVIQLGIDRNGDGVIDSWENARPESAGDALSHADRALGLRISLLVASRADQVVDEPVQVCFPAWGDCGESGVDLQRAPDRRFYRVYSATVGIRNRLH